MTENSKSTRRYYVYALTTEPEGPFQLDEVFYIGKGIGYRYKDHLKDAIKQRKLNPGKLNKKQKEILKLRRSDFEKHVFILNLELIKDDAFAVESAWIKLIRGIDGTKLANIVGGHHETRVLRRFPDVRPFVTGEFPKMVKRVGIDELSSFSKSKLNRKVVRILVKGSNTDMEQCQTIRLGKVSHVPYRAYHAEVDKSNMIRRRWSIYNPWSDEEARQRAARYWPIGKDWDSAIELMQELAKDGRLELGLLIKDGNATVLRYLWKVKDGLWEQYDWERRRFGFPLGEPIKDDPWLGCKILDKKTGKGFFSAMVDGVGFALAPAHRSNYSRGAAKSSPRSLG